MVDQCKEVQPQSRTVFEERLQVLPLPMSVYVHIKKVMHQS